MKGHKVQSAQMGKLILVSLDISIGRAPDMHIHI